MLHTVNAREHYLCKERFLPFVLSRFLAEARCPDEGAARLASHHRPAVSLRLFYVRGA